MSDTAEVRTLIEIIASHRVLPPPGALPPDSEELRAVLADIAQGSHSVHAALIREVAGAHRVAFDELARRAGFVLACVALPPTGTHYDLLGVSPTASGREIRRRWATLIQRYHPDRAGPESGLGDQARRLIEAYQTLRDPGRRHRYDAELARARGDWRVVGPVEAPGSWRKLAPVGRWKWAPVVIVAVGIVVMARWTSHQPPGTALRPAPRPSVPGVTEPAPAEQLDEVARPLVLGFAPSASHGAAPTASMPSGPGPTVLPSLVGRLAALDRVAAAPAAEPGPSGLAEQHGPGERREPNPRRTEVDGAPEAPGRAAGRGGGETSSSPTSPEGRTTPPVSAEKVPPAPEKLLHPRTDTTSPRRAVAAVPPRAEAQKPTPEALGALIEAFRTAYERKDLDGLMVLLGTDVREGQTAGRSAVQHLYAKNFRQLDGIRYEISQMTAQAPSRDGDVIVHGRFRIRAVSLERGARPLDVSGPIRWVIRREGESLRIVGIDYSVRGQ